MSLLVTKKIGMISMIDNQASLVPVTLLKAEANFVSQIKTTAKDGYNAIQISAINNKKVAKPQVGHLKKAGIKDQLKFCCELRFKGKDKTEEYKLAQTIGVNDFKVGDKVSVTGTSKGKGFAGTIKRHNFASGAKSHGGKGSTRRPGSIGSIGQGIRKGQKMPGRLGNQQTTIKGLSVKLIDDQLNLIGVGGAIPGPKKSIVIIKKA